MVQVQGPWENVGTGREAGREGGRTTRDHAVRAAWQSGGVTWEMWITWHTSFRPREYYLT